MSKKTFELSVGEKTYKIDVESFDGKRASVRVDGRPYEIAVKEDSGASPKPASAPTSPQPISQKPTPAGPEPPQIPVPSAPSGGKITAPMPGLILDIMVNVGDRVSAGMPAVKMEAMKMENQIPSPVNGRVNTIMVKVGDNVSTDQTLMVIDEG